MFQLFAKYIIMAFLVLRRFWRISNICMCSCFMTGYLINVLITIIRIIIFTIWQAKIHLALPHVLNDSCLPNRVVGLTKLALPLCNDDEEQ